MILAATSTWIWGTVSKSIEPGVRYEKCETFIADSDGCRWALHCCVFAGSWSVDVQQGCRTDFSGKVSVVPPARFDCADVAADLRTDQTLGKGDPRTRHHAQHAAVAHRQNGGD